MFGPIRAIVIKNLQIFNAESNRCVSFSYPDVYGGYQTGQPPAAPAYPYGGGYAGATAAAPSAQPPYMASYGVQQGAQTALGVMKTEPRMYWT